MAAADRRRREREPEAAAPREEELAAGAVDFLSAIRCFLHYSNARNDNTLTYELQAAAAERVAGRHGDGTAATTPAEWMRLYFRHARTLNRQLLRYLEQKSPGAAHVAATAVQRGARAKSRTGQRQSLSPCAMACSKCLTQPALSRSRQSRFRLFTEAARTGIPLSRDAERSIAYILKHPELPAKNTEMTWATLREILGSDYPGVALRPMQRLGLLTEVLPEFGRIDSLVVRDFYHRYTVDEHTLRTIEHLQELADRPMRARRISGSCGRPSSGAIC